MQRSFSFGLLVLAVVIVQCYAQSVYILGSQGANCFDTCFEQNMNCNPRIVTNDTDAIFSLVGVNCLSYNKTWSGHNQPGFISDPNSPDFGQCIGFLQMPGGVLCAGSSPDSSRICRCDPPSKNVKTFGFGLSSGSITTHENVVFRHIVAPGDVGVMTHFWTTYDASEDNGVIFRYYIDNETNPSIEFTPSLACGVGFHDQSAPWGINLFGKGAADAGWYHNIRIPFQNNVRITMQHLYQNYTNFYTILRGGTNVPITVAGLPIPSSARLQMFSFSQVLQPIEYINLAFVPRGYSGMYYLHSMSIESESLNFIEGCYRMYTADQEFPGTILGTGFEDYYNSAWAFNAGKFAFPGSGLTYYNDTNVYRLSAYRVHDSEPIQFSDGFQLTWRNGDVLDVTGVKCMVEGSNGVVVGTPTASMIQAYTWVYTWKNEELD